MARIEIGKHLAADTRVCGGRLIIRGSRVLVSDVLELTGAGYSAAAVSRQYRGIISAEAVREATLDGRDVQAVVAKRRLILARSFKAGKDPNNGKRRRVATVEIQSSLTRRTVTDLDPWLKSHG